MDHVLYSQPAVKQFLVQNGKLFAAIMDDEPEIMRLTDDRKYALIYAQYIQDTQLEPLYHDFHKTWSLDQERLHGVYKYESEAVVELHSYLKRYGWRQFMFALIELVNRRKAKSLDSQLRNSWVIIRDKLSSLNKSIKYE